ncbi:MAG: hypothetical protein ACLSUT_05760 [Christensenellales bacterium]|jgi:hypothetical protein
MSGVVKHKNKLGQKLTPSAKLFIALSVIGAAVAFLFIAASAAVYFVDNVAGLKTFGTLFYPVVICVALSLTAGINQLLRGTHALAAVGVTGGGLCLLLAVGVIIYECAVYGKFFIVPFTVVL